jgi:hypothetical protein
LNNPDSHLQSYSQSLPPFSSSSVAVANNSNPSANPAFADHRFHERYPYGGLRGGASSSSNLPGAGPTTPAWFNEMVGNTLRRNGGEGEGAAGAAAVTTTSASSTTATSPIVDPQPQSTPRASSSTAESSRSRSRALSSARLNMFETHSKFASPVVERKAPSLIPPLLSLDARPSSSSTHPPLGSLASSASQQADTLQQRLAEERRQHLQCLDSIIISSSRRNPTSRNPYNLSNRSFSRLSFILSSRPLRILIQPRPSFILTTPLKPRPLTIHSSPLPYRRSVLRVGKTQRSG